MKILTFHILYYTHSRITMLDYEMRCDRTDFDNFKTSLTNQLIRFFLSISKSEKRLLV